MNGAVRRFRLGAEELIELGRAQGGGRGGPFLAGRRRGAEVADVRPYLAGELSYALAVLGELTGGAPAARVAACAPTAGDLLAQAVLLGASLGDADGPDAVRDALSEARAALDRDPERSARLAAAARDVEARAPAALRGAVRCALGGALER